MNMSMSTVIAVSVASAVIFSGFGINIEYIGEAKPSRTPDVETAPTAQAKISIVAGTTKTETARPTGITSKPIANHLIPRARTTRLPVFFPKGPEHTGEAPTSPSGPQGPFLKKQETTSAEATGTSELQVDSRQEIEEVRPYGFADANAGANAPAQYGFADANAGVGSHAGGRSRGGAAADVTIDPQVLRAVYEAGVAGAGYGHLFKDQVDPIREMELKQEMEVTQIRALVSCTAGGCEFNAEGTNCPKVAVTLQNIATLYPDLKTFKANSCTKVFGDIAALQSMKKLKYLDLAATRAFGSFEALASLIGLISLNLADTLISGDMKALASLPELDFLSTSRSHATSNCHDLRQLLVVPRCFDA